MFMMITQAELNHSATWALIDQGADFCYYKIGHLNLVTAMTELNNDLILVTSACINLFAKPDMVFLGRFRELHSEAYIDQSYCSSKALYT